MKRPGGAAAEMGTPAAENGSPRPGQKFYHAHCDAPECVNFVESGGVVVFSSEADLRAAARAEEWLVDEDDFYFCPDHNKRYWDGHREKRIKKRDRDL